MKKRVLSIIAVLAALMLAGVAGRGKYDFDDGLFCSVSRMAQSAIVTSARICRWRSISTESRRPAISGILADAKIEGADQKVYTIVNAQPDDAGTYRLDAFDDAGRMVVSMDIAARVIDPKVPKSGDNSLPVSAAMGAVGVAAAGIVLARRKKEA